MFKVKYQNSQQQINHPHILYVKLMKISKFVDFNTELEINCLSRSFTFL